MCLHRGGAPAVHVFTGCPHQTAEAVAREGKKKNKKPRKTSLTLDPSSLWVPVLHTDQCFPAQICEVKGGLPVLVSPPFTSEHTGQEWQSGSNELPGNLAGIMGGSYTPLLLHRAHKPAQHMYSNDATRLNTHRLRSRGSV